MRQRPAGTIARSARSLSLVAACAVATCAGLLGSLPPAGAGTLPTVPGAPSDVMAYPGPHRAGVGWNGPLSDGGASITRYKIIATDLSDPARGGQTAFSPICCAQTVRGLTAGDRYTFRVAATNSVGTGPASAPSKAVVPTAAAPPRGVYCEHASGTTGGAVKLSSCHTGGGGLVGTGMMPGAVLKGTGKGTISWRLGTQSFSTTIEVTTKLGPNPTKGWCPSRGLGRQYDVAGKVTADTEPEIAVGQAVNAYICISSSGAVKQTHYGRLTL